MSNYIGVYGLGVMGQSLVLNMARHRYRVAAFNKFDYETVTIPFLKKTEKYPVEGFKTVEAFIDSLERPRKVLLMVTAGTVVDSIIEELIPLLEPNDMIIDCGNSYFKDTMRRETFLKEKGIPFFGVGISGGQKGALEGPSIMPGGNKADYDAYLGPLLETISAHTVDGQPCCAYIGANGAGHYVKMVHNGIEYGDIQIICEAYLLMKEVLEMSNAEIADVFERWNTGRLNSYLIEITAKILHQKDMETGKDMIDVILDVAGQKGTGKWTSMEALDLGVAVPTIAQSVFARCLSALKEQRVKASGVYQKKTVPVDRTREKVVQDLEQAVYASKILAYAQGFSQLKEAAQVYHWKLDYGNIALLWREGCIIRAQFLMRIKQAYDADPELESLLLTDEFRNDIQSAQDAWRRIVLIAIQQGLYMPAITDSLQYFDGYCSAFLPANLLQAQRDFFGAHTYHRIDRPKEESFHTIWDHQ